MMGKDFIDSINCYQKMPVSLFRIVVFSICHNSSVRGRKINRFGFNPDISFDNFRC